MPRTTLVLDSTQISTSYECMKKWEQSHLISITRAESPDSPEPKTAAGALGHKLLEIYYKSIVVDGPACAVGKARAFNPDIADSQDQGFPLVEETRQRVYSRFCDYVIFWGQRDHYPCTTTKREIGVRDNQLIDLSRPDPMVEQGFSLALLDTKEYLFVLEGRLDFVGNTNGEFFWMDHKWQFRRRDLYKKSIQFKNYALATGFTLGIVNYVRLADKVDRDTFVRQPISFSKHELLEWKEELIEHYIALAKARDRNHFPMNRDSCGGKFGYTCEFAPLCEEYNLQTRAAMQRQYYKEKKQWHPW